MLERAITFAAIIASMLLLYTISRSLLLRRRAANGLGIKDYQLGRPAILYFTSPGCVPCKTIQKPALRSIADHFGDSIQIFEVDAIKHRSLANQWAVLSVPTTFIIDSLGRPRKVNHKAVTSEKLIAQLHDIGEELTIQRASQSDTVIVLK